MNPASPLGSMTPCFQDLRSCASAGAHNRATVTAMAIPRATIIAGSRTLGRPTRWVMKLSAVPSHTIDTRIAAKSISIKVDTNSRHLTKRSCSIAAENNTPGLALNRIGGGKCEACQEGYIQLFFGVAN